MATVVQQLYSQTHFGGPFDGVQTVWNFTFSGGYIYPEHVKAYYLDAAGARQYLSLAEGDLIGEFQLQVDSPPIPASATRFVIYRDTPKDDVLVDFDDGAVQSEANLDRIARQAVFCAAEVLDGATVTGISYDSLLDLIGGIQGQLDALDLEGLGWRAMRHNTYSGSSTVLSADNGKAHYKTDHTAVAVPNSLPTEFLCTIINDSTSEMAISFSSAVGILQGDEDTDGKADWTLAPRNTLSITKVASGRWFISGSAT
jgi:hypothetical protein